MRVFLWTPPAVSELSVTPKLFAPLDAALRAFDANPGVDSLTETSFDQLFGVDKDAHERFAEHVLVLLRALPPEVRHAPHRVVLRRAQEHAEQLVATVTKRLVF